MNKIILALISLFLLTGLVSAGIVIEENANYRISGEEYTYGKSKMKSVFNMTYKGASPITLNSSIVFDKTDMTMRNVYILKNVSYIDYEFVETDIQLNATIENYDLIEPSILSCNWGEQNATHKFKVTYGSNVITYCFNSFVNNSGNYIVSYNQHYDGYAKPFTNTKLDWSRISNKFDITKHNDFVAGTIEATWEPGQSRMVMFEYDVKPGTTGKFDIVFHTHSAKEAYLNPTYIKLRLDPWYVATANFKVSLSSHKNYCEDCVVNFTLTNLTAMHCNHNVSACVDSLAIVFENDTVSDERWVVITNWTSTQISGHYNGTNLTGLSPYAYYDNESITVATMQNGSKVFLHYDNYDSLAESTGLYSHVKDGTSWFANSTMYSSTEHEWNTNLNVGQNHFALFKFKYPIAITTYWGFRIWPNEAMLSFQDNSGTIYHRNTNAGSSNTPTGTASANTQEAFIVRNGTANTFYRAGGTTVVNAAEVTAATIHFRFFQDANLYLEHEYLFIAGCPTPYCEMVLATQGNVTPMPLPRAEIVSVTVTPTQANTTTLLSANTSAIFYNGVNGDIYVNWTVDTVVVYSEIFTNVANGTEVVSNITTEYYNYSDIVTMLAYANDSINTTFSDTVGGNNVTIENSIPGITQPTITPASGGVATVFSASSLYIDDDNHNGNFTYLWYVNNINIFNQTIFATNGSTPVSNITGYYNSSDILNCSVFATDGINTTSTLYSTNTITIDGTYPSLIDLSLERFLYNLTLNLTYNDNDSDIANITVSWFVDNIGVLNQTNTSVTNGTKLIYILNYSMYNYDTYVNATITVLENSSVPLQTNYTSSTIYVNGTINVTGGVPTFDTPFTVDDMMDYILEFLLEDYLGHIIALMSYAVSYAYTVQISQTFLGGGMGMMFAFFVTGNIMFLGGALISIIIGYTLKYLAG